MATRKTHKARGASWESAIRDDLRAMGYDCERLARTGAKDEGDVVAKDHVAFRKDIIIEAKAPGLDGKIDLSGWLKEATIEAKNYANARHLEGYDVLPVVVIKARGKSIDEAYVVVKYEDFFKG